MAVELDRDARKEKQRLLSGYLAGAAIAGMIALGDRLGLYAALRDAGPLTCTELAGRTGLHHRWLLEWLRAQAAAGVLEYRGDERFELAPETALLLADDGPQSLGASFDAQLERLARLPLVSESFRSGRGTSWNERGAEAVRGMERGFAAWYRQVLVPVALPALDGVVERLENGAAVADVGCGAGIALIEMAKAFPRSHFTGYDAALPAITRARENAAVAGLANLSFHHTAAELLPAGGSLDLITTFDCVHDMTHPHEAAAAIRAALKPDGYWFIADIDGRESFEANLAELPLAGMFYSISVLGCLSSGMSIEGGAGLGTLGLPEPAMRRLAEGAGFTRFRRVDLQSAVNAFYLVRP